MDYLVLRHHLGPGRRRNLTIVSTAFLGLWAFPMFLLVDTGSSVLIAFAFSVGMFGWSATYGPMGAF